MVLHNQRDFWSGVMFAVIGVAFMMFSQEYEMGTAARMGPAFFPTMLGALLALLGLATLWRSTARGEGDGRVERIGWRELLLIVGAISAFAVALPHLGMVIAVTLLIAISACASPEFRWKETLVSIVVLVTLSWLVFVRGLELQFPVWPVLPGH